jgi:quercetin dioxygenase-like cupin family protein
VTARENVPALDDGAGGEAMAARGWQGRAAAVPTVQLENDRVRVTEWRFAPGSATGWHRHGYDYVVVPMTSGTLHLRTATADTTGELVAGRPYYRPLGAEHDVLNPGPAEVVFIEIEVKAPDTAA